MNSIRIFICVALILLLSPPVFASDSLYFAQVYSRINQNISDENIEENFENLDGLIEGEEFQALSCYEQGQILHKIGVSYYLVNEEREAIRYFEGYVLDLWKNCQEVPPSERAQTVFNIGLCYHYLGEPEKAKGYIDEALPVFEKDPSYDPYKLARKFQATGNFYLDNHDSFRAELYYENALKVYRGIEETENRRFSILNNLIIMSLDFKKYDQVKKYFDRAMALHGQFPHSISESQLSMIYQNMGIAHWELGELEEAAQKSEEALDLLDLDSNPAYYSNAIELTAVINTRRKNYEESISALNQVVKIRNENLSNAESYAHLSTAFENICENYIQQGHLSDADKALEKAFEALMIEGASDLDGTPIISKSMAIDNLQLIRLLALKSSIYQKTAEKEGGKTFFEKSLALQFKIDTVISKNLLSMQFQNSKLNFLELILTYYGSAIENAILLYTLTGDQKHLKTAYYFSSKTKAIILQSELKNSDAFQTVASSELIEQENDLVQKLYAIQGQMTKNDASNDSLLGQYIRAQEELEAFVKNIEDKEPEYYTQKYAFIKPLDINEIQGRLPDDLAVIEYFYKADTIYSFWITHDNFFYLPVVNDTLLKRSIEQYVDQCHNPRVLLSGELGQLLYQRLIRNGVNQIDKEIFRLCIIPDGILHTVPFEALNSTGDKNTRYLIEDYSISFSYSIGLLFREKSYSRNKQYLGFGTRYSPELNTKLRDRKLLFGEGNLAQLSLSSEEINRASAIFSGDRYLDQNASLENFYKHSGDAKIIHLSLHGLVDVDDPMRSSILFDDQEGNFVLSVADLYSHKINADLVVLSACHTASGKIFNGEGVQGMSKAFILSGAKNILSSLWSASEASSLKIMTSFLQNVHDGKPNDLALHKAKQNYLASTEPSQRHPFYWANFILIGEIDSGQSQMLFKGKLVAVLSVFAIIGIYLFGRRIYFRSG